MRAYTLTPPVSLEKDASGNTIPPKSLKKPSCLLCCKPHFPLRQFSGHFYHVTCLVLFGMGKECPIHSRNQRLPHRVQRGLDSNCNLQQDNLERNPREILRLLSSGDRDEIRLRTQSSLRCLLPPHLRLPKRSPLLPHPLLSLPASHSDMSPPSPRKGFPQSGLPEKVLLRLQGDFE